MSTVKVAIVGATGYTGSELFRILYTHPNVEIVAISSNSHAGKKFSEVQKQLVGIQTPVLVPHDEVIRENPDIVFLALPHGTSMEYVEKWIDKSFKIIDLSGDFRLSSPTVYEQWYPTKHSYPKGFDKAVYGLPELHFKEIQQTRLIANPGCFTSTSILGIAPLMANQSILPDSLIIDGKTGVTGAGAKAKPNTHFPVVNDNFIAYGIKKHRHTIEIEEQCSLLFGEKVQVQFTPHLLPVDRGILATIYAKPRNHQISAGELKSHYRTFYEKAPFVRIVDELPSLKEVRGTNYCDIYVDFDERTNNILVFSVLDNLVKGAAGVAVQNMNILSGFPETCGLINLPLMP